MPAGAVCPCGNLTQRPSRRCESCDQDVAGKRSARRKVYGDRRWAECRLTVWIRDGWRCVACGHVDAGNAGKSLDAHHTISVLELLARGLDPFDPGLVETRCKRCHGGRR